MVEESYSSLGESYERSGMLDRALVAYEQAREQNPSKSVDLAVGRVYEKMGDLHNALYAYADLAFGPLDENGGNGNNLKGGG